MEKNNPYASPLGAEQNDVLEPLTNLQSETRIAMRGCLTTSVLAVGILGVSMAALQESLRENSDPTRITPWALAWICAVGACAAWQISAARKDAKRVQREGRG